MQIQNGRGLQFSLPKRGGPSAEETRTLLRGGGSAADNPLARLNLKPALCPVGMSRGRNGYARVANGLGGPGSCGSGSDDDDEARLPGAEASRRGCLCFVCILLLTLGGSAVVLAFMLRRGATEPETRPPATNAAGPRTAAVRGSDVAAVTLGKPLAQRKPLMARLAARRTPPPDSDLSSPAAVPPTDAPWIDPPPPPPADPSPPPPPRPESREPVVPLSQVHQMVNELLAKRLSKERDRERTRERGSGHDVDHWDDEG